MNNKTKTTLGILFASSALFAIYGINKITNNSTEPTSTTTSQTSISQDDQNQDQNSIEAIIQELTLDGNQCRGCGRCVRIDPEHFEMSGGVAVIVSTTNLNSTALQQAINSCPEDAISLS